MHSIFSLRQANQMSGFTTRVLTAIVFVAVVIGGMYWNKYSFAALFALVTGLCLWEFLSLTLDNNQQKRNISRLLIGMVLGLAPVILSIIYKLDVVANSQLLVYKLLILLFPLLFLVFIFELYTKSENPFRNLAFIILGMVYIGMPFALLNFIAFDGNNFYVNTVFGMLLLTWANDSGAYMIGSKIGKTPLFPRISPKKTWEGSTGGVFVTFLVAIALSYVFVERSLTEWIVLGIIVSIFGSIGDLIESMLKRSFKIKDSGNLLPGHGGFLDRFDAFLFLIPFAFAYLMWIRM